MTDQSVLYFPVIMKRDEAKEIRRKAILDAAAQEFENRRFDEVKLDNVASRAGVGKGTLYLYFQSKEDLFAALAIEGTAEMAARIREIADSDMDFKGRLAVFCEEFSAFAERRHGLMRLLHQASSETVDRIVKPHFKKMMKSVYYLVETGVKEGALRGDLSVDDLHCLLMGPLFLRVRSIGHAKNSVNLPVLLQGFWDAAAADKKNG